MLVDLNDANSNALPRHFHQFLQPMPNDVMHLLYYYAPLIDTVLSRISKTPTVIAYFISAAPLHILGNTVMISG
jgi:hypothetical protein